VHSRLDYGIFVLVGLPAYLQRRFQSVLNTAVRLVFRLSRYDHVLDTLALHWLSLPQHVDFRVTVMAFCVLHGLATIPERSCSCRRPAWLSPTSLVIITSTACSIIPAHNCRLMHILSLRRSSETCCHLTSNHPRLCPSSTNV